MKKNDLFPLTITDMGVDGEGIGKYEGMTFFVKDALIGDRILARAVKLKKHYGYELKLHKTELLSFSFQGIHSQQQVHQRFFRLQQNEGFRKKNLRKEELLLMNVY